MRDFLLRLLSVPKPITIEFDAQIVEKAEPGALIILSTKRKLTGDSRSAAGDWQDRLRKENPDLRFLFMDDGWNATVASSGDLVIFRYVRSMSGSFRKLVQEGARKFAAQYPDVRLTVVDEQWDVVVPFKGSER